MRKIEAERPIPESAPHLGFYPIMERPTVISQSPKHIVLRYRTVPFESVKTVQKYWENQETGAEYSSLTIPWEPEHPLEKTNYASPDEPIPGKIVYQQTDAICRDPANFNFSAIPKGGFSERGYIDQETGEILDSLITLYPKIDPVAERILRDYIDSFAEDGKRVQARAIDTVLRMLPQVKIDDERGIYVFANGTAIVGLTPSGLKINPETNPNHPESVDPDAFYLDNFEDPEAKRWFVERRNIMDGVFVNEEGVDQSAEITLRVAFNTQNFADIFAYIKGRNKHEPALHERELRQFVDPTYKIRLFDSVYKQ